MLREQLQKQIAKSEMKKMDTHLCILYGGDLSAIERHIHNRILAQLWIDDNDTRKRFHNDFHTFKTFAIAEHASRGAVDTALEEDQILIDIEFGDKPQSTRAISPQ